MRWTFSIALILLLFSSCTTARQVKRYAAPHVKMMLEGELPRLQDNISVVLDSSVVIPDSMIDTKTTKRLVLPLLIAYIEKVQIRGTVSPEVLASRFSWHLSRNAELDSFKSILAGKTLKVTIKSIPNSFLYDEYTSVVGTPFGVGSSYLFTTKPIGYTFVFDYQLISSTDIKSFEKVVLYVDPSSVSSQIIPQKAIDSYFENWDNSLNQASMIFLRRLIMDQNSDKK